MAEFNETTNAREISPGPRGYSIIGRTVSDDGTMLYLETNEPRTLNGVRLPAGPQGDQGLEGLPGESRIRVDTAAGHRVFQWDAALMAEQMIYGDTGVRLLADGTTWVRRTDNTVETNALDPALDLPVGFRPVSPEAVGAVFTTADEWPETLPGTEQTPPQALRGLEGYSAAAAQGYPGTAEEWMHMVYRVVLPPAGATGEVLTRTAAGSAWQALPTIGAESWKTITLSDWNPASGSGALARLNNDTVEAYGLLTYTGATATVGAFSGSFLRVGVLPPEMAPAHGVDTPVTTYRASDNQPVLARVIINPEGVIYLGAIAVTDSGSATFTAKANVTQINLSAISFALRNSSPTPA